MRPTTKLSMNTPLLDDLLTFEQVGEENNQTTLHSLLETHQAKLKILQAIEKSVTQQMEEADIPQKFHPSHKTSKDYAHYATQLIEEILTTNLPKSQKEKEKDILLRFTKQSAYTDALLQAEAEPLTQWISQNILPPEDFIWNEVLQNIQAIELTEIPPTGKPWIFNQSIWVKDYFSKTSAEYIFKHEIRKGYYSLLSLLHHLETGEPLTQEKVLGVFCDEVIDNRSPLTTQIFKVHHNPVPEIPSITKVRFLKEARETHIWLKPNLHKKLTSEIKRFQNQ